MYAYLYVYMYTGAHVHMYMFVYMYMCVMKMCMGLYVYMDKDCYEDICGTVSQALLSLVASSPINISAPLSAGLYLLTTVSHSLLSLKLIVRVIVNQKSVPFAKRVIFLKKNIKCSSILLPSKVSPFLLSRP